VCCRHACIDLVRLENSSHVARDAHARDAFSTFAEHGATAVELKVEATNARALRLYERLGMRIVERLDAS
jgi:RimJ/RimL family protein N-acetyltransferase